MITRIVTQDLRGHSLDINPEQFTVISGPHGSGKTSAIMAAHLALLGYVPGEAKKGAAVMANCAGHTLGAAVEIDDHTIGRRWQRTEKGISETVKVDGQKAAGKAAAGMLNLVLGEEPRLFDGFAFWNLSDRETRKAILRVTAGDKADDLLDLDAVPRASLNKARANREAAEKALALAVQSLQDIPPTTGDIGKLKASIEQDRSTAAELSSRISAGEQADEERKRLMSCISLWNSNREGELNELRFEQETLEKGNPMPLPSIPDSIAPIPEWARKAIADLRDHLKKVGDHIGELMIDKITGTEINNAVKVQKAKEAISEREEAETQRTARRLTVSRRIGELTRMGTEARTAKGRLAKLPNSPTPQDRTALKGIQAKIAAANEQIDAATRRAQVEKMIATHKDAVEKARDIEERDKEKLKTAATTMADALMEGADLMRERAGTILPEGTLDVVSTEKTCELWWSRERDGQPFAVPRSALSGSERVVFDAAVAYAMTGDKGTAFIDAGECSNDALIALAPLATRCPCQVVLCRWTDSFIDLPEMEGWTEVALA